jgi:low temperature requirement protein LtrA
VADAGDSRHPPFLSGIGGFRVEPAHFVERHGLVVIVAIGESVIAIAIGASHLAVDASLAAAATLGLALSACLWWLYFGGDDERAERALTGLPVAERAVAAVRGYGYWHIPLLYGIVAMASAERTAFEHPFDALAWPRSAALAGGAALFLAGDVLFRRELSLGPAGVRAAAAAAALATIVLGANVSPTLQVAALVAIMLSAVAVERRRAAAAPAPPP